MKDTGSNIFAIDMDVFPAMGMFAAANPVAARAWVDVMSETTQFVSAQMMRAAQLQTDLATCTTPMDAMRLQGAFLQASWEASNAELTRYTDLLTTSFSAVSEDIKTGHRRSYDDVPV